MYVEDFFNIAFLLLLGLVCFNFTWPILVWMMLRRKGKELDKRVSSLEKRREPPAWISMDAQQPSKHGYYEVLHDNPHNGRLVQEIVNYTGVAGRIKFWRALPEAKP